MADRHFGTGTEVNLAELRVAAMAQIPAMEMAALETSTTPATPGGNNWVPLGPLAVPNGQSVGGVGGARIVVTGRVTGIESHPTDPLTIYVATARGGVWKTTTGGTTWTPMSDNAASLAIGRWRWHPRTLWFFTPVPARATSTSTPRRSRSTP